VAGPAPGNRSEPDDVVQATPSPPDDVPTWEGIARSHGSFLYNVAYRLTGNHEDAQDLVQEVLLRVRRGLATYRPGSLEGWLSRITTNAFLDDVRRRRRRPLEVVPVLPDLLPAADAEPDAILASSRLPDDVQAAIKTLPPDFRAAVVLCDVVGLDYAEIGEALGIPAGTVRSRIHRGRTMLRELLR
jgi:RNA polymerase sigma factor (sigma-70 family)